MTRSRREALRSQVARRVFSEGAFRVLGRTLGPTGMGRICARLVKADTARADGACLCIVRDVFVKDVERLRQETARRWPTVSQQLLYLCMQAWVPSYFFHQTRFQASLATVPLRGQSRAERFSLSFLRSVARRHGVAAVLTGNVDYAPDEFIRRAAARLGIPFLVLLKEHANTDYGHRKFAASLVGYRFEGDAVAVFGPRTRQILIDERVCPESRIMLTGPPRYDAWSRPASRPVERSTFVLFSFSRSDQEGASTFGDVLGAFADASMRGELRGYNFVVKCRDAYEEGHVTTLLPQTEHRLQVTSDLPVPDVLQRARAAVGFSSLALTEALLSRATIISPRFGDCVNDEDAQFDQRDERLRTLVRFPSSVDELLAEVLAAVQEEPTEADLESRVSLIHSYFCEPRPTYSALVDAFVEQARPRPGRTTEEQPT